MILGIGIDIVDNKRIKNTLFKYGGRFKNKCFSIKEIKRSESSNNIANSYSKRFAAKEACAKALGLGLSNGIHWKDIEVLNNENNKPIIRLYNNALKRLRNLSKNKCFIEVSLSDEKNYSIANVIIFKKC